MLNNKDKEVIKTDIQIFSGVEGEAQTAETADGVTAENETAADNHTRTDTDSEGTAAQPDEIPDTGAENIPEGEEGQTASADIADIVRLSKIATAVASARFDEQARAVYRAEEEKLRESYPSFSFEEEMKNEVFACLVKCGIPVKNAYEAANFEKLLTGAMHYAAKMTAEKTARAVPRIGENPVLDRATAVRKTDVGSLTEQDIRRIIAEAGRGAKITFR